MNELLTEYHQTGNCIVNIEKVIAVWNNDFSISQWHDEYRLIQQNSEGEMLKFSISTEQATEIINKLKLLPIKSGMFAHAQTWRTRQNIISEKERIQKIIDEKLEEVKFTRQIIRELENALS